MSLLSWTQWAPIPGAGLPLLYGQPPYPNQALPPHVRSPCSVAALLILLDFDIVVWLLLHADIFLGCFTEGHGYHSRKITINVGLGALITYGFIWVLGSLQRL